jgi:hypothetical protein
LVEAVQAKLALKVAATKVAATEVEPELVKDNLDKEDYKEYQTLGRIVIQVYKRSRYFTAEEAEDVLSIKLFSNNDDNSSDTGSKVFDSSNDEEFNLELHRDADNRDLNM